MATQGMYYLQPAAPLNAVHLQHYVPSPPLPVLQANFQVQGQPQTQWATGICYSCFNSCDDFNLCCVTCWCPCITFGRIAEIVSRGSLSDSLCMAIYGLVCFFTECECILTGLNRSRLRSQYGLPASPCSDIVVHVFCHRCALRQEYRELSRRGFDMKTGWNANVYRMQQQLAVVGGERLPPTMDRGMTR